MFYSHTFLARKGPLGTVWCAAHLQHKLKKSHYTSTNIPSTVERIMYPEVPIALRMSGHLLLGVVRIHSKQVDYLFEDCNVVRITINRVFTTVSVNLPEDARHAPYHSITLPETYDLDAINLDDYHLDWQEDSHVLSLKDITLTAEQIPTGQEPYIVISINEDDSMDPSSAHDVLRTGAILMEGDAPPVQVNVEKEPSHRGDLAFDEGIIGTSSSPQDFSSIEIMRDADHGSRFLTSPILPDRIEPDKELEEQIIKDKKTSTPPSEKEAILSGGQFPSSHGHQEPHSFERFNSPINFDHKSPEIGIRATPPVAVKKVRRRKRKLFYDECTVLSNRHMKNALNDTGDIRRAKRNCPCTSLDVWKVNTRLKKNDLFFEPLISGSCADIHNIYREDFITSKAHLISTEQAHQERSPTQTLLSTREDDNMMEIEYLRNNDYASPDKHMPSPSTLLPPTGRSCFTPENRDHALDSEHLESTDGFGTLPTTVTGLSSGHLDSEIRTPETFHMDGLSAVNQALSDIPELLTSAGELAFLEQDDISPTGFPGTPEVGFLSMNQRTPELQTMSSRTRAVAQYLKKQSSVVVPMTGNLEESSVDLSLKKILEGKSRKICARMFSETLVLKNFGLLDVNQDVAYDDITLKLTENLSKEPFSA